jgi:hypothetical protein
MIMLMNSSNRTNSNRAPWWFTGLIIGLMLIQVGGMVRWLWLSSDVARALSLPSSVDAVGQLVWSLLLAWAVWSLIRGAPLAANRSIWLLIVFIIYSVLRLLAFSQADYDRQRYPLLLALALIPFVSTILLCFRAVWGRSYRVNREQIMENESDGSRPQDPRTPPQT